MQNTRVKFLTVAFLALATISFAGCNSASSGSATTIGSANIDANDTAATVNGKPIKMEEVERGVKQQAQGQESKLSPLELAQLRLQTLEGLIQNEVLYQKAEKEGTVPTDDEVTAEVNKRKTASGLSAEKFDEQMKQAGMTEAAFRDTVKKGLAVTKLVDKITGKIEPPKDSEIDDFYKGNKEAFVKKRGVKLAAIVIDPADNGEGDTTKSPADAAMKIKEIASQLQAGEDFAKIAREKSEDNSKLQSGDLGYISEDDLRQNFSEQIASGFMNPQFPVGKVAGPFNIQGKYYIFKLQERSDKDENLTLESPDVRQGVITSLINARKQLLSQSYAAIAMNEAKIENLLAQKVVANPNELSGARPASADTPNANANTNSAVNANTSANTGNTNPNAKPAAANSPAAKASTKPAPTAKTGATK
ncbi:MAG: SurA N-terminal domain-containing protein [Acidobacteriota bacterium]|nr:SurA N-terminal domain-containing protein [Acidobacteriota bacterium]